MNLHLRESTAAYMISIHPLKCGLKSRTIEFFPLANYNSEETKYQIW